MHGDVVLGGPVWLLATAFIMGTAVLAIFVIVDSLRPLRRSSVAGRLPEPLWAYTAVHFAFLATLGLAQILAGISLASAAPVAVAPFALATGVAYLLRAVFPRER